VSPLRDAIAAHGLVLSDGAWGTNLMSVGLDPKRECAESWNLSHPDVVRSLARAYSEAGAQLITTNTFGGNSIRLAAGDRAQYVEALNEAGVRLAREGAGRGPLIAGTMGPTGLKDIAKNAQDIGAAFGEQARALENAGVDFLVLETMTSPEEATIALRHILKHCTLDVVCSFAFRRTSSGTFSTWSGASTATAIAQALDSGAAMTGVNCYPADETLEALLREMHDDHPATTWWLKPNGGSPPTTACPDGYAHPITALSPAIDKLYALGVRVLGGCCGTTPAHIAHMQGTIDALPHGSTPDNR